MELRRFNLSETTWSQAKNQILSIRRAVYLSSRQLLKPTTKHKSNDKSDDPKRTYFDDDDSTAYHWLAHDANNVAIGAIRLLPDGKIAFLMVLEGHRLKNVGASLLEQATERARYLEVEQVSLDSPNSTVSFLENKGFKNIGEIIETEDKQSLVVDESKNYLMVKKLIPIETFGQRKVRSGNVLDTQVRNYDTFEIDFDQYEKLIRSIRRQVWTNEMQIADSSLSDDVDSDCKHFVSITAGQLIGALRMDLNGMISGLVVDSDFRRQGVASSLLEAANTKAVRLGLTHLALEGTEQLLPFFEKTGFLQDESNEGHYLRPIKKTAIEADTRNKSFDSDLSPDHSLGTNNALGTKKDFLLLRTKEDFQGTILELCLQARQSIQILSPYLDHKLFDRDPLRKACSDLARLNKYTHVEILLYDPHRVIKNGHTLVELARRLPSSMQIKIVHPELRQLNHEFVIADGQGYVYRQDIEAFEGSANFYDVTEANRLARQFRRSWESGLIDPNLRQLKL
ncbi:MAG: GNAT superfamily N-acetyltransferase [Candidatus Azotimanducaceae bacterium]|jgi:GNAT superfamily N-acetyltransferase